MYSSSLLLPVRGLTPTACKIYFHTDQFSFLHNQNSISDGLNGKKKKKKEKKRLLLAEWWCAPGFVRGALPAGRCREGSAASHGSACLAGGCRVRRGTNCSLFWVNEVGCHCQWPREEVHASVDKHCPAHWDPRMLPAACRSSEASVRVLR